MARYRIKLVEGRTFVGPDRLKWHLNQERILSEKKAAPYKLQGACFLCERLPEPVAATEQDPSVEDEPSAPTIPIEINVNKGMSLEELKRIAVQVGVEDEDALQGSRKHPLIRLIRMKQTEMVAKADAAASDDDSSQPA